MSFFVVGWPKSVEDLSGKSLSHVTPVNRDLRSRVRVLIIDDNPFAQKDNLRSHGYDVHVESDLSSLTVAEGFQIVLCDLNGVGQKLGGDSGGFLIKEIKKNYPQKYVVAYSGHTFDATFNYYLNQADAVMKKDADLEEWIDKLDEIVKSMIDPIAQWKRARGFMIDQSMRLDLIMHLEDEFVSKIEDSEELEKWQSTRTIKKLKPAAQKIIGDLVSGLLVGKITGG